MSEFPSDDSGVTVIKLGHFQLIVYGREFSKSEEYWDANWLVVMVRCENLGASVWAKGPIVHLSELEEWRTQIDELKRTLSGEANLNCMEPNLAVNLSAFGQGHIKVVVNITPDYVMQAHSFEFEIDQTYLRNLIRELDAILTKYPIRGKP